jgi:hypothetical protein
MLYDPSRFLLASFGRETAFQTHPQVVHLGAVVSSLRKDGKIIRCDSSPVVVPEVLLPRRSCVDVSDREQCG